MCAVSDAQPRRDAAPPVADYVSPTQFSLRAADKTTSIRDYVFPKVTQRQPRQFSPYPEQKNVRKDDNMHKLGVRERERERERDAIKLECMLSQVACTFTLR